MISTIVELAGFASLSAAAFYWNTIAGLVTLGLCLLVVGRAIEDGQAVVTINRMVQPVTARVARLKMRYRNRRFRRNARRRDIGRRLVPRRQPAEIVLRVQRE